MTKQNDEKRKAATKARKLYKNGGPAPTVAQLAILKRREELNAKHSPKNNAKNNAKVKEERNRKNEKLASKCDVLDKHDVYLITKQSTMEALTTENPTLGDVTSIVSVFASGGTKEAAIAEGWKSFYGRGGSITSKVRAIMTANPGMSDLDILAHFKLHATPPKLLLSSNNANIIDDFEYSWHVRLRGLKGDTGVWQEFNSKGSCYSGLVHICIAF